MMTRYSADIVGKKKYVRRIDDRMQNRCDTAIAFQ
jgi:hypothetical protein